jgi:hypothetical protein
MKFMGAAEVDFLVDEVMKNYLIIGDYYNL